MEAPRCLWSATWWCLYDSTKGRQPVVVWSPWTPGFEHLAIGSGTIEKCDFVEVGVV